jgi:DNA-binding MarR family transcriptional regulator
MVESIPPDNCNFFALRQAARFVTQIYERHLSVVGLTAAQFTILSKIAKSPEIGIAELSQALVMDRTTLVRALSPLQRDGLVLTEQSHRERRAQLYGLSVSGKATLARALVAWQGAQKEFEGRVGRDRAKSLRSDLFEITAARD